MTNLLQHTMACWMQRLQLGTCLFLILMLAVEKEAAQVGVADQNRDSTSAIDTSKKVANKIDSLLPQKVGRHSGIPEIDSLPLDDWKVENPPLSYAKAAAWSVLPGGAQFYGGHPVRGGFLVAFETILIGLGLNSLLADLPKWEDDMRGALDSADAALTRSLNAKSTSEVAEADRKRFYWLDIARERSSLRFRQADLASSELAWAIGLHAYGLFDGMEIVRKSRRNVMEKKSVQKAFWRGLVFPGGGQLYNERFGKFGLLYMTFGAAAVSAWSRQQVVDHLNQALSIARREESLAPNSQRIIDDLELDRTLYRKRRNQYYWGIAFFYVYAVMDGMVDAAFSDFDHPSRFALLPGSEPMSLALQLKF